MFIKNELKKYFSLFKFISVDVLIKNTYIESTCYI